MYFLGVIDVLNTNFSQEINQLHAEICSALADSNRIMILYALADQALNVTEIAHTVGISQPAASRHLNVLRERGMVSARREGQSVLYFLNDERIIQALDLLRAVLAKNLTNKALLADNF
jgi:ArsR family transcriptional regulator